MTDVPMPRLSDSMVEGTIAQWLVADGVEVSRGQEIVEIETDKATMAYEADATGVLSITAPAGATLPIGETIARIGGSAPVVNTQADPSGASSKTVEVSTRDAADQAVQRRVIASPVARKVAAELGLDIASIVGTGPRGRVTGSDVKAAGDARQATASAGGASQQEMTKPTGGGPSAVVNTTDRGSVVEQPLSRVQRLVAARMCQVKGPVPDFALSVEVDMGPAQALQSTLKRAATNISTSAPSINDMVIKAVGTTLREFPRLNASYDEDHVSVFSRVNVGFAVAAGEGLLVPTIFDADHKPLTTIRDETRALAARARAGEIAARDLEGGTFTVSNLGMLGIESFSPILNTPQVAILAVGALRQEPVVEAGAVVVGIRMNLSLVCDHRVVYGAEAASYLAAVRERLQEPASLLL